MSVKRGALLNVVGPEDIDISREFVGTSLNNRSLEAVTRNIVFICRQMAGDWVPFTWVEYRAAVTHKPSWEEISALTELARRGLLHMDEPNGQPSRFTITDKFIATVWDYVKYAD